MILVHFNKLKKMSADRSPSNQYSLNNYIWHSPQFRSIAILISIQLNCSVSRGQLRIEKNINSSYLMIGLVL